jgi:hypothetical protein
MQKQGLFIFLCVVLVLVIACNRKVNTEAAEEATLIGKWELREEQSGMIPTRQHPEGKGDQYRFTATTYERYRNGALEQSGVYRVVVDSTAQKEVGLELPPGEFARRIVFEDDTAAPKTFFQLNGDTLVFLSGYFPTDGGSRFTYRKIAENN